MILPQPARRIHLRVYQSEPFQGVLNSRNFTGVRVERLDFPLLVSDKDGSEELVKFPLQSFGDDFTIMSSRPGVERSPVIMQEPGIASGISVGEESLGGNPGSVLRQNDLTWIGGLLPSIGARHNIFVGEGHWVVSQIYTP